MRRLDLEISGAGTRSDSPLIEQPSGHCASQFGIRRFGAHRGERVRDILSELSGSGHQQHRIEPWKLDQHMPAEFFESASMLIG